jgi:hypothetical protein
MARIKLSVFSPSAMRPGRVISTSGAVFDIPFFRLFVLARLGSSVHLDECVLDTGAPVSVIHENRWRTFEPEIEWLSPAPGEILPDWLTAPTGFAGGSCPCRLGIIRVTALGAETRPSALATVPVLAQFLEDGPVVPAGIQRRVLFGLHGGILEGRRLTVEKSRGEAWLEDL